MVFARGLGVGVIWAALAFAPEGAAPTSYAQPDAPAPIDPAQADPALRVDECVRSEMSRAGIHGAQIAVARDGAIIFARAYGRRHRDRTDLVDPLDAALTQDCGTWLANGAGSFQFAGIGRVTFIEDPVDTGRLWLRHRQFVASRDPVPNESIAVYLPFAGAASRPAR